MTSNLEEKGYSLRNNLGVQREHRGRLKFEMVGKHKTRRDLVRVFALSLAVLFVLFIGQALNHSHLKGQNEASCQVCQAADIGSGPTALTASLFSPLLAIGKHVFHLKNQFPVFSASFPGSGVFSAAFLVPDQTRKLGDACSVSSSDEPNSCGIPELCGGRSAGGCIEHCSCPPWQLLPAWSR